MINAKNSRAHRLLFLLGEINFNYVHENSLLTIQDQDGLQWHVRYDDRGDIVLQGPDEAFRMSTSVFHALRDTALMMK